MVSGNQGWCHSPAQSSLKRPRFLPPLLGRRDKPGGREKARRTPGGIEWSGNGECGQRAAAPAGDSAEMVFSEMNAQNQTREPAETDVGTRGSRLGVE